MNGVAMRHTCLYSISSQLPTSEPRAPDRDIGAAAKLLVLWLSLPNSSAILR